MSTPTPIPITAARSRRRPPDARAAGTRPVGEDAGIEQPRRHPFVLAPRARHRIVAVRDTTGTGTAA
jgi:hypothetical protein